MPYRPASANCIEQAHPDILVRVMVMFKEETLRKTVDDLRLNPELRLCAKFDALSIADFPVAAHEKMGVRVVDNCAEEHIM